MKTPFQLKRIEDIHQLESDTFDILIIGGGISGAGLALDSALRGLRTALIEKKDFASGTSSKSTKLIHGGLRYLKNMEFSLVREVGRERKILLHAAPHLVIPEKMLLPMIKGGQYGKIASSFGLWLYDKLIQVSKKEKRRMLNSMETIKTEPLLNPDLILGSGLYTEYRTDDSRLTIEVIKTATRQGAICVNHCKMESFIYTDKSISGIICKEALSGKEIEIKAHCIINAGGPWVDEIRIEDTLNLGKRLHLTKGVHIVLEREKLPIKQSIYFDTEDHRMIFAIPRADKVYIGTTDTDFGGKPEKPEVELDDVNYLLNATKKIFYPIEINVHDVISSWSGIRPLIHEEKKSPSQLSRKDEIFLSESGLISLAGGKLTAYRKMAEKVINLAAKILKKKFNINSESCKTENIQIIGGEFKNLHELKMYSKHIESKLENTNLPSGTSEKLIRLYGRQTDTILNKFFEFNTGDDDEKLIRSELWFCVHNEFVYFADDFFERRSSRLFFDPNSIRIYLPILINDMKTYLNWSEINASEEFSKMNSLLNQITNFKKMRRNNT